jgi:cobalt/nickel transport system permease protein
MKERVRLACRRPVSGTGRQNSISAFLGSDRSAVLVTMLFMLSVVTVPKYRFSEVLVFAAYPLFIHTAAGLGAGETAGKLMKISPFIVFMAAANLFYDRTEMLSISGFSVTGGMLSAGVIVAKTFISVAGLLALTSAVPFHRVCRALGEFHVPEVLVTQLMLLYRYISVLQEEALSMQKARDMRAFGGRGRDMGTTASLIGSLLLRSTDRAERIYRAMVARGFGGRVTGREPERFTASDLLVTALWSFGFLLLRLFF